MFKIVKKRKTFSALRLKQVEAYYWNKLIENSTPCWFILYEYIVMHGQQNLKKNKNFFYGTLTHFRATASLSFFLQISTFYAAVFQFRIWGRSTACLQQLNYGPMYF